MKKYKVGMKIKFKWDKHVYTGIIVYILDKDFYQIKVGERRLFGINSSQIIEIVPKKEVKNDKK